MPASTSLPGQMGIDGLTANIATHVAAVANTPLNELDIEMARRLLLDNFLVSLWGSTRPCARQIADWAGRFDGSGASPALGGAARVAPSVAALVHGTAAHSYELDDTHDETTSHPGSVVIPAALAVAAELEAPQAHLLSALAAGYEAMALVGCAAGGLETVHRGFHPTPIFGSFGAAAACVCLHAYQRQQPVSDRQLISVWGHALSQAGGSMQFSMEPSGGEVKRVHAGLGARNGVLAAQFADMPAVSAPHFAIEGRYGLAALFGGPLRAVTPGATLQIHNISLKPYACCRLFHSTIDALSEITEGFRIPPGDIAEIVIAGPRLIADQHMTPAQSTMTAQYSCPYIVGATLAWGPRHYQAYEESFLDDPEIRNIASKVRFQINRDIEERYYPKRFATEATIRFTDGRHRSSLVVDSLGTPRKPMSVEQIMAKGDHLKTQFPSLPTASQLAERLWDNDGGSSLARALSGI